MRFSRKVVALAIVGQFLLWTSNSHASGSTVPAFQIDATNSATYTTTGSSVNSSVSESANSNSGTATSVTLDSNAPTPSFNFNGSAYVTFANNVKPDLTNGISIQFVAKIPSGSYTSGSWPRVFDFGQTTGYGGLLDNFSIQIGQFGSIEYYMDKSGVTGSYTCISPSNTVIMDSFALYSIHAGPGVCSISVNNGSVSTTSSEATTSYASHVPNTTSTWASNVATMAKGLQSPFTGYIRSLIISSGSSSSNSVIFMPNGGSGFTASQTGSASVSLNANQYTRTGMSFTGWNTKADGSGTQYADGATFNLSSSSNMLFAQWASIPPALTMPAPSTVTYRTSTPIVMTINTAGSYTFYDSGKKIPGCINLSGSPSSVTCNWKPAKIGSFYISAKGIVSGSTYYSNSALFKVRPRSNSR